MVLSDEVQLVLHRAVVGARELGHPIITPEHVALELILDPEVSACLERSGTDLVAVESRLRTFLKAIRLDPVREGETVLTSTFQRWMNAAIERTTADGREFVMIRDLFVALLDETKTVASTALREATPQPEIFEELRTFRTRGDPRAV